MIRTFRVRDTESGREFTVKLNSVVWYALHNRPSGSRASVVDFEYERLEDVLADQQDAT